MDDEPPQDSTQYSALLAFEDYLRMDDDPLQNSTQHHSALLEPFDDYSGEVPTSQSLEAPVSTSQSLQNVSKQQRVHALQYQPKPTPLQSIGHNHQIIQLPTHPNKRQKISNKRCGCKVSKCQKRYCECYAAGELCGENCSCQGCFNKSEHEATEKRNSNMCHNPQAVYGAPTLNSFAPPPVVQIDSVACPQANSFTTSSNISPHTVQMAVMAQRKVNSFATSSNISPPQAVQMATMARPQANPGIAYWPQQRHTPMNPPNPFVDVGHRVFSMNSVFRPPSMQIPPRLRHEANNINMYWKQRPRE